MGYGGSIKCKGSCLLEWLKTRFAMKRNLSFVHLLLAALSSLTACATDYPATYSAQPIQAKVIDAETRQPLAGVIVTANWKLTSGNAGGSTPVGQMMVLETATDKDGVFRFPAWGPLKRKAGFLLIDDPQLLLFKSGYDYRRLNNYRDGVPLKGRWRAPVRTSQWGGKTIEMKRFRGTGEEYAEQVYQLDSNLDFARYGSDCEWKKIPHMLVAVHRASDRLDSQGVRLKGSQIGVRIRKVTDVGNQKKCGSPEEFFKSYLK